MKNLFKSGPYLKNRPFVLWSKVCSPESSLLLLARRLLIQAHEPETTSGESRSNMEVQGSSKKMIATQAEMVEARVPISYRDQCDQCFHLLILLNKCRQSEFYLPWKCENERDSFEKCEYERLMGRMLGMHKILEEKLKKGIPLIPKTRKP